MVEVSDIDFKCTVTGQPFVARLTRSVPDARFVLSGYAVLNEPAPAHGALDRLRQMLLRDARPAARRGLFALRHRTAAGVKGWLVDAAAQGLVNFGFDPDEVDEVRHEIKATLDSEVITRSADEYDWTGFKCPCCPSDRLVGKCVCGVFGCQGTAEEKPGGRHWQCSCGWSGFLGGTMSTVEEKKFAKPREIWGAEELLRLPAPEMKRLPSPARQLPPPRHGPNGRR
jgi:hypothetical protein